MTSSADIVICGAGIAGVSTAYHLAVRHGVQNIILVDERPPLTLTSDKSTEAYRNWWPGPDDSMVRLMNRSIDLLEDLARESDNRFMLNRRGYVYATADPVQAAEMQRTAELASQQGAGPVRVHRGLPDDPPYQPVDPENFEHQPSGADHFLDAGLIQQHFPYLNPDTIALLHTRRCGWFSGQQLGMYLLEQAQAAGASFLSGRVTEIAVQDNRVEAVRLADGTKIHAGSFVNAAGPMLKDVGTMLGVDLPVFSELHVKVSFPDSLGIFPREAPLIIWQDPQHINWGEDERAYLAETPETRLLLDQMPAGVHGRPEGPLNADMMLILWPYHTPPVDEVYPIPTDPMYPEVALRGMMTPLPDLSAYAERMPKPYVDGGYYTKTKENRLLSGPLPIDGAFVLGALSGFGLMTSQGAADLLAAHIAGSDLPEYAPAFLLERYDDPAYQQLLDDWGPSGQL